MQKQFSRHASDDRKWRNARLTVSPADVRPIVPPALRLWSAGVFRLAIGTDQTEQTAQYSATSAPDDTGRDASNRPFGKKSDDGQVVRCPPRASCAILVRRFSENFTLAEKENSRKRFVNPLFRLSIRSRFPE